MGNVDTAGNLLTEPDTRATQGSETALSNMHYQRNLPAAQVLPLLRLTSNRYTEGPYIWPRPSNSLHLLNNGSRQSRREVSRSLLTCEAGRPWSALFTLGADSVVVGTLKSFMFAVLTVGGSHFELLSSVLYFAWGSTDRTKGCHTKYINHY